MRKSLAVCVALLGLGAFGPAQVAEWVSQADALFQEVWLSAYTPTDAPALRAKLERAIDLYTRALTLDPQNPHILNMLARAYYTLADIFLPEREKGEFHEKGQVYGERSLRAQAEFVAVERERGFVEAVKTSTDVAALYWTYANWARKVELGGALGILAAALRGDDKKLSALMSRCLELDRFYLAGGPLRAYAAYFAKHPFSKDYERARELLLEAIRAHGDYLENRLFYVQYYLIPKELWAEARAVLQEILAAPIQPYPLMNSFCQVKAAALLAELQGKG
ncbi:TRAP transporter TatT component family protein [Thermus sp.]|uniref:TRAP transporter TatT component family protein n=1 Tax=Thermus sp. TaxID=275 RepID=UPI00262BEE0C|nr:TRAP transporter TatT component family protein [Thermus sp.]MCS7216316.1 TRAP transporter TatT component family protein [Candidatus Bipolaricaulota bacterium]MCX7850291.1 TRAP transporter TatT component family protein [Thermus sp.]MDW8151546.1 TRAP transporter TatT component family protein [Candidatus Bipolaricaulota bacterium]